MQFEIKSAPGWNEPGKGQHSAHLIFILSGERGAFVWQLATGIGPTGPYPSQDSHGPLLYGVNLVSPMGFGVTAHSELTAENATDSEYNLHETCEYLSGRACCCTYQRHSDNDMMQAFAAEGIPGVQRRLTELYLEHYGVEP